MTEPTPLSTAPQPAGTRRGLKIALAVSVALNLAVAGLVAGAWVKGGPGHVMPRDLSFGPFSEALNAEDRRALRKALLDRAPGFRDARKAAQAEFTALLAALRASPFDPAAAQSSRPAGLCRPAGKGPAPPPA
jgi:uncharacterized membrane protein